MKLFKDLDEIYKGGLFENDDDKIECSVCGKKYKRKTAASNHIKNRNCFKYSDMFGGTLVEPMLFDMYKECVVIDSKGNSRITLNYFRKTSMYTVLSKFWLFCFKNNITNGKVKHFFNYLINESYKKYNSYEGKREFTYSIVSKGTSETSLINYRKACVNGLCTIEMSNSFYKKNEDLLISDVSFMFRSLERGDITFDVLFDKINFDEVIDKLSQSEINHMGEFLSNV